MGQYTGANSIQCQSMSGKLSCYCQEFEDSKLRLFVEQTVLTLDFTSSCNFTVFAMTVLPVNGK